MLVVSKDNCTSKKILKDTKLVDASKTWPSYPLALLPIELAWYWSCPCIRIRIEYTKKRVRCYSKAGSILLYISLYWRKRSLFSQIRVLLTVFVYVWRGIWLFVIILANQRKLLVLIVMHWNGIFLFVNVRQHHVCYWMWQECCIPIQQQHYEIYIG